MNATDPIFERRHKLALPASKASPHRVRLGSFGPWVPGIDPIERTAQLRCLAALAAAFLGPSHRRFHHRFSSFGATVVRR
jgi:hypothetical protein